MEVNELWETALSLENNSDLEDIFLKGRLSRTLIQNIKILSLIKLKVGLQKKYSIGCRKIINHSF